MSDDQLRRLHKSLKEHVSSLSFEDNSQNGVFEAYTKISGELQRRENDKGRYSGYLDKRKELEISKQNFPKPNTTVNFTMDRGTGYEQQHTGKVVEWNDPNHIYVKDNLNEKIFQLDGHEIDKVYSGPTGLVGGKQRGSVRITNQKGSDLKEGADFLSSILHGSNNDSIPNQLEGLKKALPKNAWTKDRRPYVGINTADFRTKMPVVREITSNSPKKAANYIALVNDNLIRNHVAEEHNLNHKDSEVTIKPFMEHYKIGQITSRPDYSGFKKDLGVMLEMGKNKGSRS